ncbi:MAG: alpha/beta fold hydrolase [Bacteroidota bacterium]
MKDITRYLCTRFLLIGILYSVIAVLPVAAQEKQSNNKQDNEIIIEKKFEDLNYRLDQLEKALDDIQWYNKVGDVALIDKVFHVGPPPAKIKNPTAMGARNPVKFWSYIFIPQKIDRNKKYPLIILPHGGVHADFTTYHTHIVREMIAQGYVVIAPDYRGSTGYGKKFYEQIDYGGLEIEDVHTCRDYMIENYDFIDEDRIGIVGWSHGGLIALMNIFEYPKDYAVAFAGVPVSDLITRLGYQGDDYAKEFSADYHIGKTVNEDVEEYKKRSPVWNVQKLKTPLLIHTNTNDDDVYSLEVENLIHALKAEGKKFEYEIFKDAPGGHSFDRIDTKLAKQIRVKIYKFLDEYLHPPHPITSVSELMKAGYR